MTLEFKKSTPNDFKIEDSIVARGEKYYELEKILSNKGFDFLNPAVLARFGEDGMYGDAASLFTVIEEENKKKLLKLGWGEFSHETFSHNPKTYPNNALKLQTLPTPMFVLNQADGYFDIQKHLVQSQGDVVEYLKKYAKFGFIDGKLHIYQDGLKKRYEEIGEFSVDSLDGLISKVSELNIEKK